MAICVTSTASQYAAMKREMEEMILNKVCEVLAEIEDRFGVTPVGIDIEMRDVATVSNPYAGGVLTGCKVSLSSDD